MVLKRNFHILSNKNKGSGGGGGDGGKNKLIIEKNTPVNLSTSTCVFYILKRNITLKEIELNIKLLTENKSSNPELILPFSKDNHLLNAKPSYHNTTLEAEIASNLNTPYQRDIKLKLSLKFLQGDLIAIEANPSDKSNEFRLYHPMFGEYTYLMIKDSPNRTAKGGDPDNFFYSYLFDKEQLKRKWFGNLSQRTINKNMFIERVRFQKMANSVFNSSIKKWRNRSNAFLEEIEEKKENFSISVGDYISGISNVPGVNSDDVFLILGRFRKQDDTIFWALLKEETMKNLPESLWGDNIYFVDTSRSLSALEDELGANYEKAEHEKEMEKTLKIIEPTLDKFIETYDIVNSSSYIPRDEKKDDEIEPKKPWQHKQQQTIVLKPGNLVYVTREIKDINTNDYFNTLNKWFIITDKYFSGNKIRWRLVPDPKTKISKNKGKSSVDYVDVYLHSLNNNLEHHVDMTNVKELDTKKDYKYKNAVEVVTEITPDGNKKELSSGDVIYFQNIPIFIGKRKAKKDKIEFTMIPLSSFINIKFMKPNVDLNKTNPTILKEGAEVSQGYYYASFPKSGKGSLESIIDSKLPINDQTRNLLFRLASEYYKSYNKDGIPRGGKGDYLKPDDKLDLPEDYNYQNEKVYNNQFKKQKHIGTNVRVAPSSQPLSSSNNQSQFNYNSKIKMIDENGNDLPPEDIFSYLYNNNKVNIGSVIKMKNNQNINYLGVIYDVDISNNTVTLLIDKNYKGDSNIDGEESTSNFIEVVWVNPKLGNFDFTEYYKHGLIFNEADIDQLNDDELMNDYKNSISTILNTNIQSTPSSIDDY